MIEETYRCIHCGIDIEGSRAWITHLTSEEHRAKVKREVLQAQTMYDDDDYPAQPYRGEQWD